ncbi:small acid-soluble spore protein K [Alteribacter populi]|nr:small acid-soluble spore protein K [Alteribacter populi]
MRNKAKGFPNPMKLSKDRNVGDEHASKRTNGETNDRPYARMQSSNEKH